MVVIKQAPASCPRSLDCALQRREFCPPGSGACGPCLPPFQEDDHGRCIQKQLSPSAMLVTACATGPASTQGCPGAQGQEGAQVAAGVFWDEDFSESTQSLRLCRSRLSPGTGRTSVPSLEEEIDFLADVLARHEAPRPHSLRDGKPRTTPVPTDGRQRVASGLRVGLLQQGPSGSKAAATLPTSTSAAVPKYPVEASPIPSNDDMVLGLIVVCTVAGISALIVAAVCWCRLQKEVRLAQKADYSAQRVASPLPYDKISPGDKTLAQSAQMYHYQHQKQQMLSMEKHKEEPKLPDSASSDEENEDGDFTVYECPGLAPTGEMEVRNPLFDDSSLHPSNPKSHQ
ncbi:PREDICTED: neural proliferation differentiation and control protein 1 [Charadrius vociferus]|uniref:neural proliferation differentiation and control protein 1 n=1 Tax=Charadrius vociferus TaxID=50402 RepID=UPI000521A03F|nr:PREDICTED: neural proliferation differentiation and control protein 1 [Charadrius vociferus]